jgi:uncharacterized protein YjbI with pentapeptide repeats
MTANKLLAAYEKGERNFCNADLSGANLRDANLRDADLSVANLVGAYLSGANLRDANLSGANLRDADLSVANLRGAYLSGANLRGADLRGANLSYAYLGDQWIIQGPIRSDGYHFMLMRLTGEKVPMVRAGCRWLSLPNAKKHWGKTRGKTQLGLESLDILIWLERAMNLRGLK